MTFKSFIVGGVLLGAGLACGGDRSASSADAGMEDSASDAAVGTGGRISPTTGGSSSTDFDMLLDSLRPDCDPAVPTSASCGGATCPESNFLAAALCEVPCCASLSGQEVCGTRNATLGATTECVATPAQADPDGRCPSVMAGSGELPGCCTDNGLCGAISTFSGSCITESAYVALPATPSSCDAKPVPDAMSPDSGPPPEDAGPSDAGTDDAALQDAAMDDAATDDAATDDAGLASTDDAGA